MKFVNIYIGLSLVIATPSMESCSNSILPNKMNKEAIPEKIKKVNNNIPLEHNYKEGDQKDKPGKDRPLTESEINDLTKQLNDLMSILNKISNRLEEWE